MNTILRIRRMWQTESARLEIRDEFPVDEELKLAALTKTQKKSLESGMLKESEKEAGSQSVEPNETENRGADEKKRWSYQ